MHYVNIYHVFHVLFMRFMLFIFIVYDDEHVCLCQIKYFDFLYSLQTISIQEQSTWLNSIWCYWYLGLFDFRLKMFVSMSTTILTETNQYDFGRNIPLAIQPMSLVEDMVCRCRCFTMWKGGQWNPILQEQNQGQMKGF